VRIAVIPARGGSRRIPRKNIRAFCGRPIIAWSIDAARSSRLFDHVIVSTEDDEIADVAVRYGAEVPFRRPADLAGDHTDTIAVIAHATEWAIAQQWPLDAVCCIYATAPLIQVDDLTRGIHAMRSGEWTYAFAAAEFPAPIFRAFRRDDDGAVTMFYPEHFQTRSQDLPIAFYDAGQFYWGRPEAWLNRYRIFDHHSFAIPVPSWRVQDIDTTDDWMRAELMFDLLQRKR
jgi:N-acylneuraminate cytidylyltransferase